MLRSRLTGLKALALGAAVCCLVPARAADPDKLTPPDVQILMVFNVRQAFESPLAKKKGVVDIIKAKMAEDPKAKEGMDALGLDPFKDLESIQIAMGKVEGPMPEGLLVVARG